MLISTFNLFNIKGHVIFKSTCCISPVVTVYRLYFDRHSACRSASFCILCPSQLVRVIISPRHFTTIFCNSDECVVDIPIYLFRSIHCHCPGSLSLIPVYCRTAAHTINLQLISTIGIGIGGGSAAAIGFVCAKFCHSHTFTGFSLGKLNTVCLVGKMRVSHSRTVNCTVIDSLLSVSSPGT